MRRGRREGVPGLSPSRLSPRSAWRTATVDAEPPPRNTRKRERATPRRIARMSRGETGTNRPLRTMDDFLRLFGPMSVFPETPLPAPTAGTRTTALPCVPAKAADRRLHEFPNVGFALPPAGRNGRGSRPAETALADRPGAMADDVHVPVSPMRPVKQVHAAAAIPFLCGTIAGQRDDRREGSSFSAP